MASRKVTRGVVHGSYHGSDLQLTLVVNFTHFDSPKRRKKREKEKKIKKKEYSPGQRESMYELKSRLVQFRDLYKVELTSLAVIFRRDFVST